MRSYEEVAERVFQRGNEIIKRNKRRRRAALGICASAACLAVVVGVSFGEWARSARSRRNELSINDIDLNWTSLNGSPAAASSSGSCGSISEEFAANDPENANKTDTITSAPASAATDNAANVNASADVGVRPALLRPVDGVIVERTDEDGGYAGHKGVDFQAPLGTPVYAAANGSVVEAVSIEDSTDTRGSYVVIQHDDGYATSYCHLNAVSVAAGERVAAGDVIGEVGLSGNAVGEILHFELRQGVDGTPLNPLDFLPSDGSAPDAEKPLPVDGGAVGVTNIVVTTVIDDFRTDAIACPAAPQNGEVIRSLPLNEAMNYYGDTDENGEVIYYLNVHFFKDGIQLDPSDPLIREDEWNRLDGLQREFMTCSENWGETNTYYVLLRLTKTQIESFTPAEGLGYIFTLVNENGNGPVSIDRDVIHLPNLSANNGEVGAVDEQ